MRPLAAFALAALAGCGGGTIDDLVHDHVDDATVTYASCGVHTIVQGSCEASPAPVPAPIQCLIDAEAACKPAYVTITQPTIEGDPIYTAYIVVPEAGGCSVTTILDTRSDEFGPQDVLENRCTDFTTAPSCPWVLVNGCDPLP